MIQHYTAPLIFSWQYIVYSISFLQSLTGFCRRRSGLGAAACTSSWRSGTNPPSTSTSGAERLISRWRKDGGSSRSTSRTCSRSPTRSEPTAENHSMIDHLVLESTEEDKSPTKHVILNPSGCDVTPKTLHSYP